MGQSRVENILEATIAGSSYTDGPQSRLEALLLQLKEVIEQGGGGSTPTAADVSYDNTTSGMTADDVQDAIDEVFQSVSSGKTLVAGAITDKGVTTSASDTFATMATNIAAIPSVVEGEVVINWYSGWVGTTSAQEKSYTATEKGTLFVSVLSGALQIEMTGWDRPRAYLNNVEQTALSSGGGKWDSRYTTGTFYATYSIDMDEDDVALITAIPATPSSNAGRVAFINAVFVSAGNPSEVYEFTIGTYSGTVAKTVEIQHTGTLSCMMIDEMHTQAATMTVNGTAVTASVQNYFQGVGYDYFETQVNAGDTVVVTYYGNNGGSTRSVILMTVDY